MPSTTNFAQKFSQATVRADGAHTNAGSQQPASGGGGGGSPTGVIQLVAGTGIGLSPAGGTGVVTVSAASQFTGYQYPENFGATATGAAHDDSTAIMAAYAACISREAVFLSGSYGIGTATPVVLNNTTIGVMSTSGALFVPTSVSPASIGCTIGHGNWTAPLMLPQISGFSGTCLRVQGSLAQIICGGLGGGPVGLEFYTNDNTQSPLQNTVTCTNITSCTTAAIQLTTAAGSTGIIEGNYVFANFVNGCNRWVYWPSGNTADISCIENTFICAAYETAGATPNYMIDMQCTAVQPQNTFRATDGCYGFTAGDYYVRSAKTNGLDQCIFDFGPGTNLVIAGGPSTAQQYQIYTNPESGGAYQSAVRIGATLQNPGVYACATSANSRASAPWSTALYTNRIPVSLAVSMLALYATTNFYAYSPFVQGNCKLSFIPTGMGGCVIDSITDNSAVNPNEILIVVRNVGSASASATLNGILLIAYP